MSENQIIDDEARAKRRRSRTTRKRIKRALMIVAAVGVVIAVVIALRPKPVPVDAVEAAVQTLTVSVLEDGKTQVVDRYDVIAPTGGTMPRITLDPGDPIEEGQVLTRITPLTPLLDARSRAEARANLSAAQARLRQVRAEVSRAEAALEEAQRDLERQEKLWERRVISKVRYENAQFVARTRAEELRAARFAAKVAAQNVSQAEAVLGLATDKGADWIDVVAPASGRVFRVFRRDAGAVAAGTQLIQVGDPARLEVVVDVLTTDAVQIEPGAPARIVRWGGGETLNGRVDRIEPSAFTRISALGVEEQRVNVIIRFEEPGERVAPLGDGYRVEAEIIISEGPALAVPASAVFRHGDGWAVYRISDGVAELTEVTVGRRSDRLVEITAGVEAGQQVVSYPGDAVSDGTEVESRG